MSGKSAPTTPGILSRNVSGTRLNSRSFVHFPISPDKHSGGGGSGSGYGLSKSKSTTLLVAGGPATPGGISQQQRKRKTRYGGVRSAPAPTDDGEWLFRAGAAITSEARESKGQSWLVSRESSTSLVTMKDEEGDNYDATYNSRTPISPRFSRNASRAASARASRRSSGVGGSRPDLTFFTPLASRTPARELTTGHHDYFGDLRGPSGPVVAGPDFVLDEQDEEDEGSDAEEELRERLADAEVARLARSKGFGLGGLVDRLVGWTLFDVGGEGRETEDEDEDGGGFGEQERGKQAEELGVTDGAQRVRVQQRGMAPSAVTGVKEKVGEGEGDGGEDDEGQGGWSDAAWLLSVASKVLL